MLRQWKVIELTLDGLTVDVRGMRLRVFSAANWRISGRFGSLTEKHGLVVKVEARLASGHAFSGMGRVTETLDGAIMKKPTGEIEVSGEGELSGLDNAPEA